MYIPPDKGITGVQLTKSDSRVSPATIQHHLHRKPSYNIQPKLPISQLEFYRSGTSVYRPASEVGPSLPLGIDPIAQSYGTDNTIQRAE